MIHNRKVHQGQTSNKKDDRVSWRGRRTDRQRDRQTDRREHRGKLLHFREGSGTVPSGTIAPLTYPASTPHRYLE